MSIVNVVQLLPASADLSAVKLLPNMTPVFSSKKTTVLSLSVVGTPSIFAKLLPRSYDIRMVPESQTTITVLESRKSTSKRSASVPLGELTQSSPEFSVSTMIPPSPTIIPSPVEIEVVLDLELL